MRDKFPTQPKMKAQYELYKKRKLTILQTIKNALQENDLMLEIMSGHQNYEFSIEKRKSLVLKQNIGFQKKD